jgi:signal transduction histidine kinase
MAAAVAHEVRNPIAAMQLKAENALAQPDSQRRALEFVLREIRRLDETVKELLKKAEPVSTHSRLVCVPIWLMERVDAFTEQSAVAGIDFRIKVDVESWSFDPLSLGRALDNLIANAIQHTPRGGVVTVAAKKNASDTAMILQVSDTGPGVSIDIEPRLFEPFTSGRRGGVGLGLALAREIAVAHGGAARYLRKASGACFELEIPWLAS